VSEDMAARVGEHVIERLRREWGMSFRYDGDLPGFIGRAAIEAMREVAPVVRDADGHVIHELRGAPEDIWHLLIDAALNQKGVEG
jgi:hypothetical protein